MPAEPSLQTLTYMSTATAPMGRTELLDLLAQTRPANEAVSITGALLYSGHSFVQTLEGPEDAVARTFAEIQADPRHRNLIVVLREPIVERAYDGWSMGFRELDPEDAAAVPGFTDFLRTGRPMQRPGQRDLAHTFHRLFRSNYGRGPLL